MSRLEYCVPSLEGYPTVQSKGIQMTEEAVGPAPRRSRLLTRLFQFLLYVPIQIVFTPFALVGLLVGIHKGLNRSKNLGVSFSAIQALQYRWFM